MRSTSYMSILQVLVVLIGISQAAMAAPKDGVGKEPAKPSRITVPGQAEIPAEPIYAVVNGSPITVREYQEQLAETMRVRYYHGTIPEGMAEGLYKDVADLVIDRALLVDEAKKRGIKPDPGKFEKHLADLDSRYATEPEWQERRAEWVPRIKSNLDRQSMVEQLEKAVRDVPHPTADEVRNFYDKNPDLFTEPERLRLSIILLKVDPGAAKKDWDQAREEAQKILDRIKNGADFAEQARLYSQHDSAAKGGDMGYLHGGMLPRGMEDKIGMYQEGIVNEPVTTLEGIVLSRIENRVPAKLREFKSVEQRARDLLIRKRADDAWQGTLSQLRAAAKIRIVTPQAPKKG